MDSQYRWAQGKAGRLRREREILEVDVALEMRPCLEKHLPVLVDRLGDLIGRLVIHHRDARHPHIAESKAAHRLVVGRCGGRNLAQLDAGELAIHLCPVLLRHRHRHEVGLDAEFAHGGGHRGSGRRHREAHELPVLHALGRIRQIARHVFGLDADQVQRGAHLHFRAGAADAGAEGLALQVGERIDAGIRTRHDLRERDAVGVHDDDVVDLLALEGTGAVAGMDAGVETDLAKVNLFTRQPGEIVHAAARFEERDVGIGQVGLDRLRHRDAQRIVARRGVGAAHDDVLERSGKAAQGRKRGARGCKGATDLQDCPAVDFHVFLPRVDEKCEPAQELPRGS